MKILILILMLAGSGWAQNSELETLRAENARLKAQLGMATGEHRFDWMSLLPELMTSGKPTATEKALQDISTQLEYQNNLLQRQENRVLYPQWQFPTWQYPIRIPNCYRGALGIVNCW